LLRGSAVKLAFSIANAQVVAMVERIAQDQSKVDYRNVALAQVALADCLLRQGNYEKATSLVDNAFRFYPNLTNLQKAEALRLKANATIAKDGINRFKGEMHGTYSPEVVGIFKQALSLDPSGDLYVGHCGNIRQMIVAWAPTLPSETPGRPEQIKKAINEMTGKSWRIHCI
jgi:hypothetical protein